MSQNIVINNYTIEPKHIGCGNFSTIYKGYHNDTGQKVAVKKIIIKNIHKIAKHIKRELALHSKLKHVNIVNVYDTYIDMENSCVYIFMEFCEGGDLSKFLSGKPLKECYIQYYIKQLAAGLKYMIDNKIFHRDLKPHNILLTSTAKYGILKISDFGFAKEFTEETNINNTYCGSPLYMAPEILFCKGYNIKSDLWSVGVIIFEMTTGTAPYHAKNYYHLTKLIGENNIIIPPKIKGKLSRSLIELIYSLLKVEHTERIEWNDFFNHRWINDDMLLREENKLLDFSISGRLPNISVIHDLNVMFLSNSLNDGVKQEKKIVNSLQYTLDEKGNMHQNKNGNEGNNNEKKRELKFTSSLQLSQLEPTPPINIPQRDSYNNYHFIENEGSDYIDEEELKKHIKHTNSPTSNTRSILNKVHYYLKESYDYLSSHNKSI